MRDDRPGLDNCLRALRKDDVLVVWKLDRLGRNLAIWSTPCRTCPPAAWACGVLAGQGAQVDTTTAAGRLVFGIFAALAEFERELFPGVPPGVVIVAMSPLAVRRPRRVERLARAHLPPGSLTTAATSRAIRSQAGGPPPRRQRPAGHASHARTSRSAGGVDDAILALDRLERDREGASGATISQRVQDRRDCATASALQTSG